MAQGNPGGVVRAIVERVHATTEKTVHALEPGAIRSEDVLRRVLGTLPGMIFRCRADVDRTIEFASLGSRSLTGFDPMDLVGSRRVSYARLIHPDDRARVQHAVGEAVRSGDALDVTYRIVRVDGLELWVRELGCPVRDEAGQVEVIEGLVTAVERHEESESAPDLREIVHDLNNVLGLIKTTAELVLLDAKDPTVSADVSDIVSAANRGSTLTRRLLHPDANPAPKPTRSE